MKDVKAALVVSSWEILVRFFYESVGDFDMWFLFLEEVQELRRKGVVLASKKSARTAAEGFLVLELNEKMAVIM